MNGRFGINGISVSAIVIRANGKREDLGEIYNSKKNDMIHKLKRRCKKWLTRV